MDAQLTPAQRAESRRPDALLTVKDLWAGYGDAMVVRDVTLCVGTGEIVTVVGPNGSGKSTLLKTIMGLAAARSGSVLFAGREIHRFATEQIIGLGIGYVPQDAEVFSALSVRENLEMGGYRISQRKISARVSVVIDVFPRLGALCGRRAGSLSGGERKMVSIARALVSEPRLLVLDEPTSGLTKELSEQLFERDIATLASVGVAALIVEQKAHLALGVADWSYVLVRGRIGRSCEGKVLHEADDLGRVFLEAGQVEAMG